MARSKRLEKKLKAREQDWVSRAESLYLKGEFDAFLASVRRRGGGVPATLATAYAEVRQRVLYSALAAADLKTVRAELCHGRVEGAVGALARAVVCCLDGSFADARTALQEAGRGEGTTGLDGLSLGLAALAGESNDLDGSQRQGLPAAARTTIESFHRLQAMATAALDGRSTGRQPLDDPRLEAVRQMIAALVTMRHRNHSPGTGSVAKLEASCARLADTDPESRIVAAVAPRARVLRAVIEAEKRVRARRGGAAARALQALEPVADRLEVLGEDPPTEAAAVHFALRRRSRSLLAAVARTEGAEGLATLVAEMPALAAELALDGRTVAADEPLLEARRLREPWDHLPPLEFADRVAHLAKRETDPLRVAQLIQIELDGRMGAVDVAPRFGQDPVRVARGVLERVLQIASGMKRLPRAIAEETAKLLRADLADLTFAVQAGFEWQRAAETMLVHRPGDPFLLIMAVAGAHAAGDATAVERLQGVIRAAAENATNANVETELLTTLIEGLSSETVATLDVALGALRRLVPPTAWDELRPQAAEAVARSILMELIAVEQEHGSLADPLGESMAEFMAARVGDLAPHLGGEPEFDALRVTLACIDSRAADSILRVDGFLAKHRGFHAALALCRDLMRVEEGLGHPVLRELTARVATRAVQVIDPSQPQEWLSSLLWLLPGLQAEGLAQFFAVLERERKTTEDPAVRSLLSDLIDSLADDASFALPSGFLKPEPKSADRSRPRAPRKSKDQLKLF